MIPLHLRFRIVRSGRRAPAQLPGRLPLPGPDRRGARAGRLLRHPLPRTGARPPLLGAVRARPPRRPRPRHGPGPRRPGRPPGRHPVSGALARLRHRRLPLRQRAGHLRRRGGARARLALRRGGLRRPGAPARPPAHVGDGPLLRLPDRLLLLRGAPGQGLLDRGAGPGRRGARRVRRGPGGTPGRAGLRPPGGAARRPRPGVAHRPLAGGHADRPGPPRAAHGAAPRALPAHAAPGLRTGGRPRRRRPPVGAPPRRPRRVRPGVRLRRLGARRTRLRRGAEAGPHRPGGAADQGGLRLMRLHRLTVQAFGPFAGAEEVDFDRLGAAGLFLVHGPTGAGKTSVLDAVCFALYGGVPGVRGAARSLQSTHAPPDLRPEVALEFTVRGRRLRITRSPAWRRPKTRGSGTTEEKAKVAVAEHTDGTWRPITLRPDEAGQFVSDLLGVNLKQFCQVVLLPQGEFARFLRAPARERRDSLEQIFGTGVFTDVEKWLAEHSAALGRAAGRAETSVLNTARLLAEVARSPLPEAVEDDLDSL